jgi:hypothetical protein
MKAVCPRLGLGAAKQQAVGNVVASAQRKILIAKAVVPAEPGKNLPNQVIFCLAFIWPARHRETVEQRAKVPPQRFGFAFIQRGPLTQARDRFGDKVAGEKTAGNR